MALRVAALTINSVLRRQVYPQSFAYGEKKYSESVSSKPKARSGAQSVQDHLIYNEEHFALKESLNKVWGVTLKTTVS